MNTLSLRDKLIPWYFVLFFVVIIAVNAVMVTLALRTHTGMVTDHPYEKGLAYNHVVEAYHAQEKLGWNAVLSYEKGILHFTLRDRAGHVLTPDEASATFIRPTQQGFDFTVRLDGPHTPVVLPRSGLWEVRIEAVSHGAHYQHTQRIVAE